VEGGEERGARQEGGEGLNEERNKEQEVQDKGAGGEG